MYIVIAGAGMVGGTLAEQLIKNNHDVVVIDQNKETCDSLYARTGVVAINGTVTSIDVLKDAGIEKADVAVAATENDTDNLAFSVLCKSFEIPLMIARIRNPNYEKSYRVAGVDSLMRVTDILVHRMLMEIEHPDLQRIASIANGQADIFKIKLPELSILLGKSAVELAKNPVFSGDSRIIGVGNSTTSDFYTNLNKVTFNKNDVVYVLSNDKEIDAIGKLLNEEMPDRRE